MTGLRSLPRRTRISIAVVALLGLISPPDAARAEFEDSNLVCRTAPALAGATYDYGDTSGWRVVEESVPDATTWSGHHVRQAITANSQELYAAYYDDDRRLVIAHRASPGVEWTTQRVPGSDAVVGWDSHNLIELAVDAHGQLHVAANMHNNALRYWRTTEAGDVTSLTRVRTMVDPELESSVTYPSFFEGTSGELLFSYREGGSGSGSTYINRYDEKTRTWSSVLGEPLFTAQSASGERNAYVTFQPEMNSEGYFEVVWVWRDTPDAGTNSRLSYMRSKNLTDWETASGDPVSLPVSYDTPGVVVDDIPSGGGILNGASQLVEAPGGRPVIAYYKYDANGNHQLFAATPGAGEEWKVKRLTTWHGRVELSGLGSISVPLRIREVALTQRGHVRVDFACSGAEDHAASLVLDASTLEVLAETPSPTRQYPPAVYQNLPTDSPATVGASQVLEVGETRAIVLRWQSQGVNADQPFPSASPPLPLRVFELRRQADLPAPNDFQAHASDDRSRYSLQWSAPAVKKPNTVDYLVEHSTDGGRTWSPARQLADTSLTLTAQELGAPQKVRFRVSVVTPEGVGVPASSGPVVGLPEAPRHQTATAAALIGALVLAATTYLLRRVRRRRSGRPRRRRRAG